LGRMTRNLMHLNGNYNKLAHEISQSHEHSIEMTVNSYKAEVQNLLTCVLNNLID